MARCIYCSTTILFGGVGDGSGRFCNERCRQSHLLLKLAEQVPAGVVHKKIRELRQRSCPKCGRPGPCDVHRSFRVASALLVTEWSNTPQVCCRRCARRSQAASMFSSLCLGWWGLPWGIIMTPIQVCRNIAAIFRPPDSMHPSAELEKLVRIGLAGRRARQARTVGAGTNTPAAPAADKPAEEAPAPPVDAPSAT